MELKIDSLNADEFGRLNDYVRQESNEKKGSNSLKVLIEGIEEAGGDLGEPGQVYKGVKIRIEESGLTKKELNELMGIVYCYKRSGGRVGGV